MSLKIKIIAGIIAALILFVAVNSTVKMFQLRASKKILESNIRNGYEEGFKIQQYYKAENGRLVAKNSVLQYSNKQLVHGISADVLKELRNLGIKPQRITYYTENVLSTEKEIITQVKDSIVLDTVPAEVFSYSDAFYNVHGIKIGDTQKINISSFDSIIQVVYWGDRYSDKGKKMPGWWFFTHRRLEQALTSNNPSSKFTYSKTLQITK